MDKRQELIDEFDHGCDGWGNGDNSINKLKAFEICAKICLRREREMLAGIKEPLKLYLDAEKARVYGINQTSANNAIEKSLAKIAELEGNTPNAG